MNVDILSLIVYHHVVQIQILSNILSDYVLIFFILKNDSVSHIFLKGAEYDNSLDAHDH